MRKPLLLLSAVAVAAVPIAGSAQVRTLDPKDVAEAQQQHGELIAEFGGAETGPRASYTDAVGRRVAVQSGVANAANAYHFTLLNSAVVNAFSVPGGYVYMTRQLMTLMDDESQLAFALGHEVGHVAANHAELREQAARPSAMSVIGAIIGNVFGGSGFGNYISQAAQVRSQLSLLQYSRAQEYQADQLGIRYMTAAGYDPFGSTAILEALARSTALQARIQGEDNRQLPEWASTHPLSEHRAQQALAFVRQTGRVGTGTRNRNQFLDKLDGLVVDDDPSQGIIDGRTFTHPDLKIQFSVPQGYLMQNGTRAVSIKGSAGEAEFSGGGYRGSLDTYIVRVLQDLTDGKQRLVIPSPRHVTINGMPAAFTTTRAQTNAGAMDVSVIAYQWDADTVYHFIVLTRAGTGIGPFTSMADSLRRVSPAEAAAIRPRVIDVVTVAPGDSVQSLASRMAYRDYKLDRFLSLNGLSAARPLVPGQRVKLIVFGARRA